ncbi:MAG: sulfatase-like hydrolase/transferase, partial [Proteobacteria bacterium]|nr:sulfatase-like hydrolase/transferase [Pseudomonadota bacterium]
MTAVFWLACGGSVSIHDTAPERVDDSGTAPVADPPTNVLMISLDTLRVEDLVFAGGSAVAPELDAFLADAEVWTDHQSCSNWTFSAVTCVMSASWPDEIGFVPQAWDDQMGEVPDEVVLGPEVLQAAGFATRLVTTSPFLADNTLLDSGFDEVSDLVTGGHTTTAGDVTDEALAVLGDLPADQPWFVHAHYIDPHQGYMPPDAYLGGLDALDELPWDLTEPWSNDEIVEAWPTLSDDERALVRAHLDVRYGGELAYLSAELGRLLDEAPL